MTDHSPTLSCFIPEHAERPLVDVVSQLQDAKTLPPFDDLAVRFVSQLSSLILNNRAMRSHPELMAVAHWFRRSHTLELETTFSQSTAPGIPLAKGIVFHVAPANMDLVFVYSWLLSLLCGNINVVRISRRITAQIDAFLSASSQLMLDDTFLQIRQSNVVMTYDYDLSISSVFSNICQLRVIWGGDQTVNNIRSIALPVLSSELVFPNRFSLAVIASQEILALSPTDLRKLSLLFYRDAFWLNQQACSSPRAVVWIGTTRDNTAAMDLFWPIVDELISTFKPENTASSVMSRLSGIYRISQSRPGPRCISSPGLIPSRISSNSLLLEDRHCHNGHDLFIEIQKSSLSDVTTLLLPIDQTITAFGFSRDEWLTLLPSFPPHSADRIVPIGTASQFDNIWDGQNFLLSFTRIVDLALDFLTVS
jgi:hypothetical protein